MKRLLFAALATIGLLAGLSAPATAAKAPPALTITSSVSPEPDSPGLCHIEWTWEAADPANVESYNINTNFGGKAKGKFSPDTNVDFNFWIPGPLEVGGTIYLYVQAVYTDGTTSRWIANGVTGASC